MLRCCVLIPVLLAGVCAQTASPAATGSPSQPLIILIGPPLSGKTTFADTISHTYGIPSISIEDLIRDNAAELKRLQPQEVPLAEMRYDPAMSRYLRERLKTADLSHGLTLDGYPSTVFQAEQLAKMFPDLKLKLVALRLQVSDNAIRQRAKTAGRQIDQPQLLEQRIKDYHREMDAIGFYFPNANIVDIDASRPEGQVWEQIEAALDKVGLKAVTK